MVRCKDFTYKWVWQNSRIQGMENYGYYEVWYKGHCFNFGRHFLSKKAAQKYVSAVVREYKKRKETV